MNEEMAKHLAVPITLALSLCGACIAQNDAPCQPALLSKERAGAVDKAVRAFAQDVARDVTRDGPIAWQKYFSDSSEFFMAVNGHLVFPNGPAAKAAMTGVARGFTHIELRWGDDLRIDPLAPDLAVMAASYHEVRIDASGARIDEDGFFTATVEYRNSRWRFRNVHWSAAPAATTGTNGTRP